MDHYNYQIQAWIIDGKVDKCGHADGGYYLESCYACNHAGEDEPK